jgi:hypothetical protein
LENQYEYQIIHQNNLKIQQSLMHYRIDLLEFLF